MVKNHSDSERGNPVSPLCMGYSFRLQQQMFLNVATERDVAPW